jgi:hypothetical protein
MSLTEIEKMQILAEAELAKNKKNSKPQDPNKVAAQAQKDIEQAEATGDAGLKEAATKRLAMAVAKVVLGLGIIGAIVMFVPIDPTGISQMFLPLLAVILVIFCTGAVFHGLLQITREPAFYEKVKKYHREFYRGLSFEEALATA